MGDKPKKVQPRGQKVVDRVLDETLRQLARAGVEGLRVPEVAERAGVNKTSVYRRWPTREALVRAALEYSMQHTAEVESTGTLEGDLLELLRTVARFVASPEGLGTVRTVFADGGSTLGALARRRWASAGREAPLRALEQARERGELPADADGELLLFTLAGALLHRVFVERAAVDEAWLQRLVRLGLYGVLGRPGARSRRPR